MSKNKEKLDLVAMFLYSLPLIGMLIAFFVFIDFRKDPPLPTVTVTKEIKPPIINTSTLIMLPSETSTANTTFILSTTPLETLTPTPDISLTNYPQETYTSTQLIDSITQTLTPNQ